MRGARARHIHFGTRDQNKGHQNRQGQPAAKGREDFRKNPYESYWSYEDVSRCLERNELHQGTLQINPKNFEEARLYNPDDDANIILQGVRARNRALHGDIVAVQLLPKSDWKLMKEDYEEYLKEQESASRNDGARVEPIPDRFYQRLAKVVDIIETVNSRTCVGYMKKQGSRATEAAIFSPVDRRMTKMYVALDECPDDFLDHPKHFAKTLFIVRMYVWPEKSPFAKGYIHRILGDAGQIDSETERILFEQGIDDSEFTEDVLDCLPKSLPWQIPEEEFDIRRDLRKECVFTIDPETSTDLDDALHCKKLENNEYEVGVHIADVSYFVKEETPLDLEAARRATSVYLIQKNIPMLPTLLGEQLCSLLPNEDRLTFSIIWRMKADGEILDEWCGRSVIRSCIKMSYGHAQDVIENPEKEFATDELPPITNGFDINTIVDSVMNLNKIAVQLRQTRFDSGALHSYKTRLEYTLDEDTGRPIDYSVYKESDSHRLVQECMILAAKTAANRIHDAYKDTALLRRQAPPKRETIDDLIGKSKDLEIDVEGSSYEALQTSLQNNVGEDRYAQGLKQILTCFASKSRQRALYVCTGTVEDVNKYQHYALNVPLYTRFTSPIRRYADIVVHRLLAASLDCGPKPPGDKDNLEEIASQCNEKEFNANRCSTLSNEMFFALFVADHGPLEEECMVTAVLEHKIDVQILKLGLVKPVYLSGKSPFQDVQFEQIENQPQLTLVWRANKKQPQITQIIKLYSSVIVTLKATKNPLKYKVLIKRPGECESRDEESEDEMESSDADSSSDE